MYSNFPLHQSKLYIDCNNIGRLLQVRAVRWLVLRGSVPMKSIAVLSQYRAQSTQIADKLRHNFPDVAVSTVVAAQGQFKPTFTYLNVDATSLYKQDLQR